MSKIHHRYVESSGASTIKQHLQSSSPTPYLHRQTPFSSLVRHQPLVRFPQKNSAFVCSAHLVKGPMSINTKYVAHLHSAVLATRLKAVSKSILIIFVYQSPKSESQIIFLQVKYSKRPACASSKMPLQHGQFPSAATRLPSIFFDSKKTSLLPTSLPSFDVLDRALLLFK